jgi:hypothetical protein
MIRQQVGSLLLAALPKPAKSPHGSGHRQHICELPCRDTTLQSIAVQMETAAFF